MHIAAWVHTLNCRLYQVSAHTIVEPNLLSTTHKSDLQTQSTLTFTNPYIKVVIQKTVF